MCGVKTQHHKYKAKTIEPLLLAQGSIEENGIGQQASLEE